MVRGVVLSCACQILGAQAERSGPHWCGRFPDVPGLLGLETPFRARVRDFLDALREAGAEVTIASARRSMQRQYLMHWAWRIGMEGFFFQTVEPCQPGPAPGDPPRWFPPTVPDPPCGTFRIRWRWGDEPLRPCHVRNCTRGCPLHLYGFRPCITAATQMVQGFRLVSRPAERSRHSQGLAVDLVIRWTGDLAIVDASGETRIIRTLPRTGSNTALHSVGASYGVHKNPASLNHWSSDGR